MSFITPIATINSIPRPVPPIIVDFGWYFGSPPARTVPEYTFEINGTTYPPGFSTLSSSVTFPAATVHAVSTTSFDTHTSGLLVINDGVHWDQITYTGISGNNFVGCQGGSQHYAIGTPIWDPRQYVDSLPLETPVTFDALDTENLGLGTTSIPQGVQVLTWLWDFGNGTQLVGPASTATFPYHSMPPNLQVSLTVFDSRGRKFARNRPVYLAS